MVPIFLVGSADLTWGFFGEGGDLPVLVVEPGFPDKICLQVPEVMHEEE